MEKIYVLLKWLVFGLLFIISIHFLALLVKITKYLVFNNIGKKFLLSIDLGQNLSDSWFIFICMLVSFVLIYLLYYLIKLSKQLPFLKDEDLFSNRNLILLFSTGKVILAISFLFFMLEIFLEFLSSIDTKTFVKENLSGRIWIGIGIIFKSLYQWIPLCLFGVIILMLAELIKKGSLFKKENDLTI
ncbi:DUF2975 domain-containing protein [Maribacter algicola]|uniref:DUF2975 domain-containing protein n=1 Tax=Meishania litoralis TaxID=3434685 RepID=A0ACC7LIF7_9FLAO